mmetsp:Transcript_8973/g.21873  ORF Transcript_8973/g.21873 Transcript_8973/m.21873 type:complete len:219 (-) Transcript_8973:150-806(-)
MDHVRQGASSSLRRRELAAVLRGYELTSLDEAVPFSEHFGDVVRLVVFELNAQVGEAREVLVVQVDPLQLESVAKVLLVLVPHSFDLSICTVRTNRSVVHGRHLLEVLHSRVCVHGDDFAATALAVLHRQKRSNLPFEGEVIGRRKRCCDSTREQAAQRCFPLPRHSPVSCRLAAHHQEDDHEKKKLPYGTRPKPINMETQTNPLYLDIYTLSCPVSV